MLRFAIFDRYIADINELHNFYIVLNYRKNFLGIFKLTNNMLTKMKKQLITLPAQLVFFQFGKIITQKQKIFRW